MEVVMEPLLELAKGFFIHYHFLGLIFHTCIFPLDYAFNDGIKHQHALLFETHISHLHFFP